MVHSNLLIFLMIIIISAPILQLTHCCIELLNNHWVPMSVEERVERAEIVLVIRVLEKYNSSLKTKKFYSAKCQILDILKGWQSFKKGSKESGGWSNQKSVIINGFGNTLDCLSDVMENEIYIFFGMFKVDMNLWATYFTSFGAVEVFNSDVYDRSLLVLGLHNWSSWSECSKKCDLGTQQRKRNCVLLTNCDYSCNLQTRFCNWQNCDNIILTNNDFLEKEFIDLKNTPLSNGREFLVTILLKNLTQQNRQGKDLFSLKLIGNNEMLSLSIKNDALIQLESDKGNKQIRLTNRKIFFKNEDFSINVYFNYSGIFVESFCKVYPVDFYQNVLQTFFSGQIKKLHSKMTKDIDVKVSTETLESFNKSVCKEELYRHFSNLTIMPRRHSNIQQMENSASTPSPQYSWSECSVTCGIGWQKRFRICADEECVDSQQDNLKSEIRTCFIKEKCPESSCKSPCQNNGHCINGKCFCADGYQGQFCQLPICAEKCKNAAKCIGPDLCQCSEGFEGKYCEKLKCEIKCLNGGQCLTPNICTCTFGFTGVLCEKRKCDPGCENGGICQMGNICSCPEGLIGNRCEKYECYPQCMNGGSCVGKNKCQCPPDFTGSFCENHVCIGCLNGGKCIDNVCHCPTGFYGSECQSKVCITGLKFRKIIKPVIIQFPIIVSNKMCINSICSYIQPQRSVIVNKVIFKPYIDCL